MTEEERALWTVVAQILPVFGLALVLEARTVVQAYQQRPRKQRPRKERSTSRRARADSRAGRRASKRNRPTGPWIQLSMLVTGGLAIAFGFIVALGALRVDDAPSAFAEAVVMVFAIPIAVAVLFLTPLTNIVLSGAPKRLWMVSRMFARRGERKVFRALSRSQRRVVRARSWAFEGLSEIDAKLSSAHELLREVSESGHVVPGIDRASAAVADLEAMREERYEMFRSFVVDEINMIRFRRELRRFLREREGDIAWGGGVQIDPVTGVVSGSGNPLYSLPDDGGFLDDPVFPLPPGVGDRLITDPADFYRAGERITRLA